MADALIKGSAGMRESAARSKKELLLDRVRLFFALYGRALQGDDLVRPLLGDSIEGWLATNEVVAATQGIPTDVARVHARLGLAVVRGLLLDLLTTGDRTGVDAALEVFARRYAGRWWEVDPITGDPSAVSARAS
jgi:hypothetical protein